MRKSLVFGVVAGLVLLAVYTASAYMGGYGYGMMGPMMGYGYGNERYAPTAQPELTEATGKVSAIYPMGVLLDSGEFVTLPWWFAANIGLKQGDKITVKGFDYGNQLLPVFISYSGQNFGDENSGVPVWMQGYAGYGYGYGYGMGYGHCPMMGW